MAVVAAVVIVGVAGCSAPPAALGSTTANVSIDGRDTGNPHVVRCSQTGWSWIIETPEKGKGFSAVIDTGDKITARSVDFRDFGGFTGTFWADNIGEAEASSWLAAAAPLLFAPSLRRALEGWRWSTAEAVE